MRWDLASEKREKMFKCMLCHWRKKWRKSSRDDCGGGIGCWRWRWHARTGRSIDWSVARSWQIDVSGRWRLAARPEQLYGGLPTLAPSNQVGNKSAIATNISCLRRRPGSAICSAPGINEENFQGKIGETIDALHHAVNKVTCYVTQVTSGPLIRWMRKIILNSIFLSILRDWKIRICRLLNFIFSNLIFKWTSHWSPDLDIW